MVLGIECGQCDHVFHVSWQATKTIMLVLYPFAQTRNERELVCIVMNGTQFNRAYICVCMRFLYLLRERQFQQWRHAL